MTKIFNRRSEKGKRRSLRNNITKAEIILWTNIRNRKILNKRFLRQFSVGKYVLDFYCPSLKLAIEIDGEIHLDDENLEYDKIRQSEIGSVGIRFIRFTNDKIEYDIKNVIR